jgi:N-acetylglucosamine-6-sulfatase
MGREPGGRRHRTAAAAAAAACALTALVAASSPSWAGPAAPAAQPNFVFILTDDQTLEQMRVLPRTTLLIGSQGATFENAYVSFPLCCPSRATFLTGQYAHNHRVLENYPPAGGFQALDAEETLPVWLSRAGYYTGLIGKLMNGYNTSPVGVPPGWSEWHGEKTENRYYGYELLEGGSLVTYGDPDENPVDPERPGTYSTDVYTDKAVDFIERRAPEPQPYFLWLSYNAPHSGAPNPPPEDADRCAGNAKPPARYLNAFESEPLPAAPAYNEADISDKPRSLQALPSFTSEETRAIRQIYTCELASLLAVDDGVERVMSALAATGELANTYVIFTSDNGFFHGEHRILYGKNRFYEEATHVPLLMRGPGIPPGSAVDELVANVDFAPTVLAAAGAKPGIPQDGRSLLPLIAKSERELGRQILFDTNTYKGIRTERYVYAEHFARKDRGERELYDLRRDPYELDSVDRDRRYRDVRRTLHHELNRLRRCDGEECDVRPQLALKRDGADACTVRYVTVRLAGADDELVRKVRFGARGRFFRGDRRAPFRAQLPRSRLAKGAVDVKATLIDGRQATIKRAVRCPRQPG